MAFQRDPVSELMDGGAAKLLRRAYARPGQWTGTSLANPTAAHLVWARREGINLWAADERGVNRWMRAFIRSLYYTHRWYYRESSGLQLGDKRLAPGETKSIVYEVGRVRLDRRGGAAGPVTIRGRAIRIKVHPGGQAAYAAVSPGERYVDNDAAKAPFVIDRDWPQA